ALTSSQSQLIYGIKIVVLTVTLSVTELGDNVTLHCAALQKGICNVYWYKQSLGFVPQTVASKVNDSVTVYPRFNSSFTVDKGFLAFNLKIRSITKDDEAIYFCQEGLSDSWSGTFVSVKGHYIVLLISRILVVFIILPVGNDCYLVIGADRRQAEHRQDPLSEAEGRVDHRDRDGAGRSGTGRVNNGESVQKPLEKKYNK
uniref:Ig-like domain-containing protein n=1 Tax=Gadus morhua TaxID=8049 RepID=A0A8C4ZVM8_GADMO